MTIYIHDQDRNNWLGDYNSVKPVVDEIETLRDKLRKLSKEVNDEDGVGSCLTEAWMLLDSLMAETSKLGLDIINEALDGFDAEEEREHEDAERWRDLGLKREVR